MSATAPAMLVVVDEHRKPIRLRRSSSSTTRRRDSCPFRARTPRGEVRACSGRHCALLADQFIHNPVELTCCGAPPAWHRHLSPLPGAQDQGRIIQAARQTYEPGQWPNVRNWRQTVAKRRWRSGDVLPASVRPEPCLGVSTARLPRRSVLHTLTHEYLGLARIRLTHPLPRRGAASGAGG